MNVIENNFARAALKRKMLRLLEHYGVAASLITSLVLLLGIALDRHWITSSSTANSLRGLLVFAGVLAALVLMVLFFTGAVERRVLAQKLEQSQPQLADRLNTLIFLERTRLLISSKAFWFRRRIASQAAEVLSQQRVPVPFPWTQALIRNGIFLLLLTITVQFYVRRDPWATLAAYHETRPDTTAKKAETPLNLDLPNANAMEEKADWGEMRITDPAKDLKITKVDTVQLQIEAAANHSLTSNLWFTTVNGLDEQPHPLPPPPEPKYAAYQPVIYADEFNLKDWDVMTYYAQAHTDRGNTYGSEVYFLEVRPFREDILKMAGGASGSAYQTLGQLTDLISRQQHIIRETHHYVQTPPQTEKLQQQDRGKLADAESDLSDTTRHLYAEIAVKMENKPIGAVLDQLGLAEKTLLQASGSLRQDKMSPARDQERLALRQLIDTRKLLQKAVTDHPEDFKDKPTDEETSPTVKDFKDKLSEMAEFRNEEKATRSFVDDLVKKQKTLAEDAVNAPLSRQTNLVTRQRGLKTELDQFSAQHPQLFKFATNELAQALDAMNQSAASLDTRSTNSRPETQLAAKKTEELASALDSEMNGRQLTSAYHLKKLLDQQINRLDQVEQKPAEINQEELNKTTDQAKETTRQLKQIAEQTPPGQLFGPGLGSALNNEKKNALDKDLQQLGQARDNNARQQLASKASKDLREVSQAFEKSQPKALQQAKQHDPLQEPNSLEKALEQLHNLLSRSKGDHPLSPGDLQKLAREAQSNIKEALRDPATPEDSKKLLVALDEELNPDIRKIDLAGLKKRMDEIEAFSTEVKDSAQKTNDAAIISVDAGKLPPAYRDRIEKYFRKLSEAK